MDIFGPHCSWWMMGGWHLLPFQASWNALGSITGTIAKENLPSFLKVVRDAVSAAKTKERRRSKVGTLLYLDNDNQVNRDPKSMHFCLPLQMLLNPLLN
jgi:hypothetical protein